MLGEARFDDSIGIFPEFLDGYGLLVLPTTGRYFQLPYGILVPQGDRRPPGRGPLRRRRQDLARRDAQPDVLRGDGTGRRAAAAVSLRDGRTTSQVDVADVQAELRRQGARLD